MTIDSLVSWAIKASWARKISFYEDHNPSSDNAEKTTCLICRDKIKKGEVTASHNTSENLATRIHKYHVVCIQPWIEQHRNCPTCKQEVYEKVQARPPTTTEIVCYELKQKGRAAVTKATDCLAIPLLITAVTCLQIACFKFF